MECPRCGARLAWISLGDQRSVYCEECRFADIESDHTRASDGEETWDDALRRFRTAHADDETDDRAGGDDTDLQTDDAPVETVHSIGPAYADQLDTVGVTTLAELAGVDAGDLAEHIDAPESSVADWIEQVRRIESEAAAEGAADEGAADGHRDDSAPPDADST